MAADAMVFYAARVDIVDADKGALSKLRDVGLVVFDRRFSRKWAYIRPSEDSLAHVWSDAAEPDQVSPVDGDDKMLVGQHVKTLNLPDHADVTYGMWLVCNR